jgi:hypothetical protein
MRQGSALLLLVAVCGIFSAYGLPGANVLDLDSQVWSLENANKTVSLQTTLVSAWPSEHGGRCQSQLLQRRSCPGSRTPGQRAGGRRSAGDAERTLCSICAPGARRPRPLCTLPPSSPPPPPNTPIALRACSPPTLSTCCSRPALSRTPSTGERAASATTRCSPSIRPHSQHRRPQHAPPTPNHHHHRPPPNTTPPGLASWRRAGSRSTPGRLPPSLTRPPPCWRGPQSTWL